MTPNTTTVPLVPGATQIVSANRTRYKGIVVKETSAGAAVLEVYDSASAASGTLVDIITLASGGTANLFYPDGIDCQFGIVIKRVSGTNYDGSVRVG
jgi:cyanophycinase-like exopeptidase